MAKEKEDEDRKVAPPVVKGPQVDEMAATVFKSMGYAEISATLANTYLAFKRKKDAIRPGYLTPEGYAFVAILADLSEGKVALKGD